MIIIGLILIGSLFGFVGLILAIPAFRRHYCIFSLAVY